MQQEMMLEKCSKQHRKAAETKASRQNQESMPQDSLCLPLISSLSLLHPSPIADRLSPYVGEDGLPLAYYIFSMPWPQRLGPFSHSMLRTPVDLDEHSLGHVANLWTNCYVHGHYDQITQVISPSLWLGIGYENHGKVTEHGTHTRGKRTSQKNL